MNEEQKKEARTKPEDVVVALKTLTLKSSLSKAEIWLTYPFAQEWFNDALHEARIGLDHHSRRREILFAVCAAESYIVEWVRDEVLNRDFKQLPVYFPSGLHRGVTDKWREIPKELYRDGKIRAKPDWGGVEWQNFRRLVDYRDGLVHASASRPETYSLANPPNPNPNPSKTDLDNTSPGWAVNIVVNLIKHLHAAVGTTAPNWLVEP